MRKFFLLILFICLFFGTNFVYAEELPDNVVLELEYGDSDYREISAKDRIEAAIEFGKYFETNYPGEKIDEDLSEDLARFFPDMEKQKLFDRSRWLRNSVKLYRFAIQTYNEIKEKILTPSAPPLLVADEEYDTPYTAEYIPVKEDEVLVIEDFKKVLAYGSNPKDFEAYQEKIKRDAKKKAAADKSAFEKIGELLSKVELKKLPFYGIYYESPFTGAAGQGRWFQSGDLFSRLAIEISAVNYQKEIKGAIEISVPAGKYVLALNGGGLSKPQYDFSESKNLKSYDIFSLKPERYMENEHGVLAVYVGNVGIPFIIRPENPQNPVTLKANIKINLCDEHVCDEVVLKPELELEAGEGMGGTMSFFVNQAFMQLPQTGSDVIRLKALVVDELEDSETKQVLRAVFKVSRNVERFEAYIDSKDGIEFSRPRIAVNDRNIVARFYPVNDNIDLKGREFAVIASLNGSEVIKEFAEATGDSFFDAMSVRLSLPLIFFGILGGLLLNLMPCVFPVLSIKLMAIADIGAKKNNKLKKNFWFTTLGIFVSFIFLAVVLSTLKNVGVAIGWGMQFQNPLFLVFMSFIITLFIAHILGLINISLPIKTKVQNKEGFLNFFSGTLVVLLATPCTAPYLGTAIGFALAGSALDIFVIMLSVALGLSLPYILVAVIPNFVLYLPKPGAWMQKLTHLMIFMLFLTIVWLLWVLAAQTSLGVSLRIFAYLLLFFVVLTVRHLFIEAAMTDEDIKGRNRFLKRFKLVVLSISLILFGIACYDAGYNFTKYRNINLIGKARSIDEDYIREQVKKGRTVLLTIGANWCLTCGFNNVVVFDNPSVKKIIEERNIEVIHIDWTNYDPDVLAFMEKFGRKGLPFYIIFSPNVPDGIVLPELLNDVEMYSILKFSQY